MRRPAHHGLVAVAFERTHADARCMTAKAVLLKDGQNVFVEIRIGNREKQEQQQTTV